MQLPEHHRAVIVLRMFNGCSTRETAELLGVPEGTVLSRLSRAMKELEKKLS
jgi:RNA polymerase sigma-70 factor (ECF subfamily)